MKNQQLEEIKDYAPAFQTVFPYIEQIVKTDKSTESLFVAAVNALALEILENITDERIRTFFTLPSKTRFCSNYFRKNFLEGTLLTALDQAIDPDKGNNGFSTSIKISVLEKNHFNFDTPYDINEFGKIITAVVPRLTLTDFGEGTSKDEKYFAVYYNYGKIS